MEKANRVLPRECNGHRKHPLPTTQEKTLYMDITMTTIHGQHQNQIDYILCSQRWRSSIQSAKTRSGADCGSDHELLIAKFRFKLKKVGEMLQKAMAPHSSILAWTRGAWQATVHGITKRRTQLSNQHTHTGIESK